MSDEIIKIPKVESILKLGDFKDNTGLTFHLCHKKPCLWFRLWQRVFLGFIWEDSNE